ncbi:hypothetical protein RIF29_25159 [Crotalaria pallida]|uniref:Uncharacterized protein n=1 Tax=Crotalaria pallida TaxID=3830 RepID=A0AAN9EN97_CROPI
MWKKDMEVYDAVEAAWEATWEAAEKVVEDGKNQPQDESMQGNFGSSTYEQGGSFSRPHTSYDYDALEQRLLGHIDSQFDALRISYRADMDEHFEALQRSQRHDLQHMEQRLANENAASIDSLRFVFETIGAFHPPLPPPPPSDH